MSEQAFVLGALKPGIEIASIPDASANGGVIVVIDSAANNNNDLDSRQFAEFAKIPVFDPSTPEETQQMIQSARELSGRFNVPIIVRATTRTRWTHIGETGAADSLSQCDLSHTASLKPDGCWSVFSHFADAQQQDLPKKLLAIAAEFCNSPYNRLSNTHATAPPHQGIVAGGVSYSYLREALKELDDLSSIRLFKCCTPFPFPKQLALEFLTGIKEVLVFEELEPVLERAFLQLIGSHGLKVKVFGKLSGSTSLSAENSPPLLAQQIQTVFGCDTFPQPLDVTPL